MRKTEAALYGVFNKARSWIPQMAEASTVSRDYWMPDQSCRVCYDCESQFTIFNRRHHCRICGKVFCGRCTVNTIPASVVDDWKYDHEEGERIRVCSYCFKIRKKQMTASEYDGIQLLSPGISPSPSVTSLSSSKSSGSDSGVNVFGAMPFSTVPYQHVTYSSALSNPAQGTDGFGRMPEKKQDMPYSGRSANSPSILEGGGSVASIFGTPLNRSDDEDDDYGKMSEDPEWQISRQTEEYFQNNFNLAHDPGYNFNEIHPVGYSSQNSLPSGILETGLSYKTKNSDEHVEGMNLPSQTGIQEESQHSRVPERSGEESEGTDNADECNDEASMFDTQGPDLEQSVDIEKIIDIWIPPQPEDEQDEKETGVFDDEDDDDDGSWGLPRSTGSFSDSEYKSKERSSEEYRKAMRSVVDGHFRALVAQLLKGEDVPIGEENHRDSWLEIVTSLSWQAASLVKPDTSKGGGMDPGGYVKVKCIASGRSYESEVIKGVACKKNVAHRRMTSKYKNARLLLLGGALEYQRVSNQLSSLDTLLQQEMEHLKMTVTKIEAHHPNVLLVEKTVSRHAQEYLLAKEISLVLNIKRPLLERIARCTGAQIVPSVDNLTAPKLGHCEFFRVEKFLEDHGSAGQAGKKSLKTLMFFDGCPKPLGCTVLLKGANGDVLKKVKRVVQYAIFAAYHLALETSFLADEGATLPELPLKSPITVALPDKQSSLDRSISMIPGFVTPASGQAHTGEVQCHKSHKSSMPGMCSLQCNSSNLNKGGPQPPVNSEGLMEGGPQPPISTTTGIAGLRQIAIGSNPSCASGVLIYDTGVKQQEINSSQNSFPPASSGGHSISGLSSPKNQVLKAAGTHVDLSSYEAGTCYFGFEDKMLDGIGKVDGSTLSVPSGSPLENQMSAEEKPHELQWENEEKNDDQVDPKLILDHKVTRCETQDSVHCEGQGLSKEDFPPSPSDQQSILVSLSTRCVWKGTICERAHLLRIKYYGSSDKPLGKFLRDDLFNQSYRCRSCDAPTEAHVHCYTHKQGSLTISVKRLSEIILPGEREGKIWMWHLCLKCACKCKAPQPTRRVVMSDAAWGLSFGKFLELSFSNHAAASRVASCGHSLHRDCLRFYGFGRMVACFRYASIHVHSVHLPPPKLEFNDPNQQDWLTNEAAVVADGAELFFAEVFDSLRQIGEKIANSGSFYAGIKVPEFRRRIAELEGMLQKEKTEFEDLLKKASTKDWQPGQPVADILELNRLRRRLIFESYVWDHRLRFLDSSLRVKRSIAGSDSSLAEQLNPHLQKNIDSILSEKLVESKRTEKDDSDPSKVAVSKVGSNGCQLDGSSQDSSSSPYIPQFEDVHINNTQVTNDGVIRASSNLESSQYPLLVDHLTKVKDTDERFGVVGKITEVIENQRPHLVEHMETNVNNSITVLSTVEKPLTDPDLCKHMNGNGANGPLPENKYIETDIGDKTEVVEGDLGVRRTLSEGNFPILADLSETLDAAWTGEGQSVIAQAVHVTSQGQEIGPAAPAIENAQCDTELSTKNSSLAVQTSVIPPALKTEATDNNYSFQDKNGPEQLQVSTPVSPVKSFDVAEEFGSWIGVPFSNLYKTYSRGLQGFLSGSPLRFDSLSGYIPTFVSSLSQLGGQGGARLLLPTGVNDTVIAIYDDEPTSIISYALTSHEYYAHVSDKTADKSKQREKDRDKEKETGDSSFTDEALSYPLKAFDGSDASDGIPKEKSYGSDDSFTSGSKWTGVADPFLYTKAMHVKVSFSDENSPGKVRYTVTCYYAKQFDALRRKCCPTEMDFIRSLCRCKKWGAQGGKSNVFFAKTLDDRFIIKQVTKTELESFIKFAPEYFKYLSDSLSTGSPTCLAKVLGIYQVTTKNAKGGKEVRMDLMVMENLLFGRNITRLYDLKGSSRSRYNADSSGSNKVLLDQNLLEAMPTSPIFVGNKAKRLLERAVWNDTSFLQSIDVMDYSLLVGVDEERHELVLGIIDFMRQYTWDKHLETWVKASGILGGGKNTSPTVISPMQYKKRFRKAMSTYFLMVPDQWSPPTIIPSNSQNQLCEDPVPMSAQGDVGE